MPSVAIISILSERHPYEVLVGRGLLADFGAHLRQRLPKLGQRIAIVTDSNIAPLYASTIQSALEKSGFQVALIEIPPGESSKSLAAVGSVCDQLVTHGLDRHSSVIALGGGVIGDLAGFVAAIYHRGIPVVQVPTTIVGQVDSAIGGKTAVNATGGKNLLGAVHPPSLVVADVATLDSLPDRDYREGFAEIIKHGAIADRAMLDDLAEFDRRQDIRDLIRRNVEIKAAIVSEDEFETTGRRALLNFGHTVGHAIEVKAGYGQFLHGEAVAIGLAVAARLSVAKAGLSQADESLLLDRLKQFQLPVKVPAELSTAGLLEALRHDKKFQAGAIRFVLTRALGSAFVSSDVTEGDIAAAIDACR